MRRAVQRRVAVRVDRVDVVPQLVTELHGLERLLVRPGAFADLPDADTGRGHQRRGPFRGRDRWKGTVVDQQAHVRKIGKFRGLQKWRGSDPVEDVAGAVGRLSRHPRVGIGAVLEKLLRQRQAAHVPGGNGGR